MPPPHPPPFKADALPLGYILYTRPYTGTFTDMIVIIHLRIIDSRTSHSCSSRCGGPEVSTPALQSSVNAPHEFASRSGQLCLVALLRLIQTVFHP
jgi:hypothetical protein